MLAELKDDMFIIHDPIRGDVSYPVGVVKGKRGVYHRIYYAKESPKGYNKDVLSIGGFKVRLNGVLIGRIRYEGLELVFIASNSTMIKLRNMLPKINKYRLK